MMLSSSHLYKLALLSGQITIPVQYVQTVFSVEELSATDTS